MIIYEIKNKLNGMSYVGQTTQNLPNRVAQHVYNKSELGSDIIKLGKKNFDFIVLEKVDAKEKLNEKELFWINKLDTMKPKGYNKALVNCRFKEFNGFYGKKHDENSRKKNQLSQNHRKKVLCIDNNVIYESTREASRETNSNRHMIMRVCREELERTNGLRFKYTV